MYQHDNDVTFSGSGFFNPGAEGDWEGVAGVHQIKQTLSGPVVSCGEDCYGSAQGSMNVKLNPVGGDFLELRQALKGLFSKPGLPLNNKPNPNKPDSNKADSNKPSRAPETLLQQAKQK